MHLFNNIFKSVITIKKTNWEVVVKFGVPSIIGAFLGSFLLQYLIDYGTALIHLDFSSFKLETNVLKICIGLLILVFTIFELMDIKNKIIQSNKVFYFGGALSGFFGGLSGHQGAFRSAFLLHADLNPQQFIATNAAIATLVDITRLIIYGINIQLLFNEVDTILVIVASCAAFAGVLTGTLGIHKVTIHRIQTLVAYLLLGIGILLSLGIL